MNELKKLNINQQVERYILERDEAILAKCYRDLHAEYKKTLDYWNSTTFGANAHDMLTIFDDVVIKVVKSIEANGGDFVKLFNQSLYNEFRSVLRKLKKRRSFEVYEAVDEDGAATSRFEIADEFNLEETVVNEETAKRKADQRQLIDFLVCGENERTTAIVQAYLTTDLKTPTAIGKHLGLDHKQVSRALNRLASKFSTKQHGDFRDYLVAL